MLISIRNKARKDKIQKSRLQEVSSKKAEPNDPAFALLELNVDSVFKHLLGCREWSRSKNSKFFFIYSHFNVEDFFVI